MAEELKRTFEEIEKAHDMVVGFLMADLTRDPILDDGEALDEISKKCICAAADVLCWVLGHAHNTNFTENLERIEREMFRRGFVLSKSDRTLSFEEAFLGGRRPS